MRLIEFLTFYVIVVSTKIKSLILIRKVLDYKVKTLDIRKYPLETP